MKRMVSVGVVTFAAAAGIAGSASRRTISIAKRQDLMKNNGAQAKIAFDMAQGATPFDAAAAKAAMLKLAANDAEIPADFPAGSDKGGDALPAIWTNFDDFKARAAKLTTAAKVAEAAADQGLDAFKAAPRRRRARPAAAATSSTARRARPRRRFFERRGVTAAAVLHSASAASTRAHERMPPWKLDEIVFLVRRMDAIVVEAEADHQRVHAEDALEHRPTTGIEPPTPTSAGSSPHSSGSALRARCRNGPSRAGGVAGLPPWAHELDAAVGRDARADEGAERFADLRRILVADEAERDLGGGLRRDHRLEAVAGVAADRCRSPRRSAATRSARAPSGRSRRPGRSGRPRRGIRPRRSRARPIAP